MSERVAKILDDAYNAVYEAGRSSAALSSMTMGYLGARIADLEAQNAALLEFVEGVKANAPDNVVIDPQYHEMYAKIMWVAGDKARRLLADLDAKGEAE